MVVLPFKKGVLRISVAFEFVFLMQNLHISHALPQMKPLQEVMKPEIVGGQPALIGQFPYQVYLQMQDSAGNSFSCGGAILSTTYVLTAAHCCDGYSPAKMICVSGFTSLINMENSTQVSTVADLKIHEQYNRSTKSFDTCILKLVQGFTFNDEFVQPIAISTNSVPPETGIVSGWGATKDGGTKSNTLQYVQVPSVNDTSCANSYKYFDPASMECFGSAGLDSCQGDSGGPIVGTVDGNERYLLCGTVSYGNGCARPGYPGVYSRTSTMMDWIRKNSNGTALFSKSKAPWSQVAKFPRVSKGGSRLILNSNNDVAVEHSPTLIH